MAAFHVSDNLNDCQNLFVYCPLSYNSLNVGETLKVYRIQGTNMGSFFIFINFPTCLH